ncbi:hypothetical protein [Verminephrobacter aporrectodeae]|uniref:hypothetical protein n=1 Tax=Verminephrobacter aporrectodeae TaxID=1110389 RepID=UPI0003181156|nr:hypothetical protein [Verminephrobacter aporrectodeae]
MKKVFGLMVLSMTFLTACSNVDSDGVPRVEDPTNPVDADGKPIERNDFIMKYCQGEDFNKTCRKVKQVERMNNSKGEMPKGW